MSRGKPRRRNTISNGTVQHGSSGDDADRKYYLKCGENTLLLSG